MVAVVDVVGIAKMVVEVIVEKRGMVAVMQTPARSSTEEAGQVDGDRSHSMTRFGLKHTGEVAELENHVTWDREHIRSELYAWVVWVVVTDWLIHLEIVLGANKEVFGRCVEYGCSGFFGEGKGSLALRSDSYLRRLVPNSRWRNTHRCVWSLESSPSTLGGSGRFKFRDWSRGLSRPHYGCLRYVEHRRTDLLLLPHPLLIPLRTVYTLDTGESSRNPFIIT